MSVKRPQLKTVLLSSLVLMGLSHCASQPTSPTQSKISDILEEIRPEEGSTNQVRVSDNPLVIHISAKLQSLGYEALGLQFETDGTLLLLGKIFDSPVSHERQIRIIYTGLAMSYDSKHQSLTIGESKDLGSILIFIDKNIPKRNSSEQINKPSPVSMPTLPTTDKQSSSIDKSENSSILNQAKSSKKKLHSKKLKGKNLGVKPSKKGFKDSKKTVTPVPTVSSSTTEPQFPVETVNPTVTIEPQLPAETVNPTVTTEPQLPAETVNPTIAIPSSTVAPTSSTISPSTLVPSTTMTPDEAIPE